MKEFKFLPFKKREVKTQSIIYDTLHNEYGPILLGNATEAVKYIMRWRISKSAELSSRNVGKRISFSQSNSDEFFRICGLSKDLYLKIEKLSKFVKTSWFISGEPFHNFLGNLIFLYYNYTPDSEKTNYSDYDKIKNNLINTSYDWVNVFLAYKYFSWLQTRQFKYGADEEVMEYTLNNMSKKFDIVKAESMMQIIDDKAFTNILYYEGMKRVIDPKNPEKYIIKKSDDKFKFNIFTDKNIVDYLNYFDSRLSDFIVNIARQYYKNHQSGYSSEIEAREIENEEGKKTIVNQTSISNDITSMVRKLILNMQKDSNVDISLLKQAAKSSEASYSAMLETLEKLRLDERNTNIDTNYNAPKLKSGASDYDLLEQKSLVGSLMLNIVSHFLVSLNQPLRMIHSARFISESLKAYSVSNVKDKYIIKIKEILDDILNKYKKDFLNTQATSTKNNFRRCTFLYFTLYIAKYADV